MPGSVRCLLGAKPLAQEPLQRRLVVVVRAAQVVPPPRPGEEGLGEQGVRGQVAEHRRGQHETRRQLLELAGPLPAGDLSYRHVWVFLVLYYQIALVVICKRYGL